MIPEEVRKGEPQSSRLGRDDAPHLVQFYDPASSWYVFQTHQLDLADTVSEQDMGPCGQLVVIG